MADVSARARRRAPIVAALLAVAAGAAVLVVLSTGERPARRRASHGGAVAVKRTPASLPAAAGRPVAHHRPRPRASRPPAPPARPAHVQVSVVRVTDPLRTMLVDGRRVPRAFDVVVRLPSEPPGRLPLIVFGHGYAVSPTPYAPLLDAWARAGYAVAAPVFPLENAGAPGGPNENDLPNEPGDLSLLISALTTPPTPELAAVARRVDLAQVAVSGQSDGGDAALAAAYDPPDRDPRIRAALILSGAEDPFAPAFAMSPLGPPLLGIQGTADTINPPGLTYTFFTSAPRPKYLLKLLGAGHLPPYTQPGPDLAMVEQVTLAFLDRYLRARPGALARLTGAGTAGPGSQFIADP